MLDSLSIAASGMYGQQQVLDSISNNLANINTASYKKSKVEFSDLVYSPALSGADARDDGGPRKGGGLDVTSISHDFSLGDFKQTGQQLDIAINGVGFFELTSNSGEQIFTRDGHFNVNKDGYIVNSAGDYLADMIKIPTDSVAVKIDANGEVWSLLQGEAEMTSIGRIELAYFTNPSGLEFKGSGKYQASAESGDPQYGSIDDEASITQGYLEISNVSMIEELTSMMLAQQAYGLNSRVIQVSDEIMGMINNLTQG